MDYFPNSVALSSSRVRFMADIPDMSQVVFPNMTDVVVPRKSPSAVSPFTSNRSATPQVFDTVIFEVFRHHTAVDEFIALCAIREGMKAVGERTSSKLVRLFMCLSWWWDSIY